MVLGFLARPSALRESTTTSPQLAQETIGDCWPLALIPSLLPQMGRLQNLYERTNRVFSFISVLLISTFFCLLGTHLWRPTPQSQRAERSWWTSGWHVSIQTQKFSRVWALMSNWTHLTSSRGWSRISLKARVWSSWSIAQPQRTASATEATKTAPISWEAST